MTPFELKLQRREGKRIQRTPTCDEVSVGAVREVKMYNNVAVPGAAKNKAYRHLIQVFFLMARMDNRKSDRAGRREGGSAAIPEVDGSIGTK